MGGRVGRLARSVGMTGGSVGSTGGSVGRLGKMVGSTGGMVGTNGEFVGGGNLVDDGTAVTVGTARVGRAVFSGTAVAVTVTVRVGEARGTGKVTMLV
jgi:hypothetical protein